MSTNKEYIIKESITTLSIAIADHHQSPNENYVSNCLDKVNNVFKPQWVKNQVRILKYLSSKILIKKMAMYSINLLVKLLDFIDILIWILLF